MAWEFVADGIILPNGRINDIHALGTTGRVLLHVVQSDVSDPQYRGTIEFYEYIAELSIEFPVIARLDSFSKAAIAVSPVVSNTIAFGAVFPPRSLRYGGMVYELFRENVE